MAEEQNIGVVQRGYEAFGRGDIESLLALLDETFTWSTPGPADLPIAGNRRGRAGRSPRQAARNRSCCKPSGYPVRRRVRACQKW